MRPAFVLGGLNAAVQRFVERADTKVSLELAEKGQRRLSIEQRNRKRTF